MQLWLHSFLKSCLFIAVCSGFVVSNSFSQERSKTEFLKKFKNQSPEVKIKMFDTLSDAQMLEYYPLVKEDLIRIGATGSVEQKKRANLVLDKFEGTRYFNINNFSAAISIFTRILNKQEGVTVADSCEILYYLKNSYIKLNFLSRALEIHKTLISIRTRFKGLDPWLFHPLLSAMYNEMGLYKEALTEQKNEYEDMEKNNSTLINYYNNRGIFWSRFGNQDSALLCYNVAKKYHLAKQDTSADSRFVIGLINGNIGQALKLKGEYKRAIPLLKEDIYSSKQAGNFVNAAISHNELAECYLNLDDYKLSEKHLDSAANILNGGQQLRQILKNSLVYAGLFSKTGRFRESDSTYRRYIRLLDSLDLFENKKQVISQQVALQMEERENRILENQKKIKEEHAIIERQNKQRNWLLAGAAVLCLVVFIIFFQLLKMSRQKKLLITNNMEIQEKKDIIEKSLHEKDLLVKEVHHRVKNNLQIVSSLLNLQAGKTHSVEAKQALIEAFDRVASMALIHKLLYMENNMTLIPTHTYLKNLFENLSHSNTMPGTTIARHFDADPLVLDLDTGIPLGLIANEVISNSYKHAFKNKNTGNIYVSLKQRTDKEYVLAIADDGVGMPEGFEARVEASLGLEIVQLLCEQIEGDLSFRTDNGAFFEIRFKIKQ